MDDIRKENENSFELVQEAVDNDKIDRIEPVNENNSPFIIAKAKDSIVDDSECPPSPLLLERSVVEFERQVEVVYNSKMIPRPKSTHTESSSIAGSTLRKNGTLNRNSLPPNGAAFVQNESSNPCLRCGNAFRSCIETALDTFFFNYGKLVATYPLIFILLCFLLTAICGMGMMNFRMENTGLKLWIPSDSSQRLNSDWLWENHPPETRFSTIIYVSDNVLTPEVIQAMYRHKKAIDSITTKYGDSWDTMCQKMPIVKAPDIAKIIGKRRRRRSINNETSNQLAADNFFSDDETEDDWGDDWDDEDENLDWIDDVESGNSGDSQDDKIATAEAFSVAYYPDPYCPIVEDMEQACVEFGLLELWANQGKYDSTVDDAIQSLTTEEILYKINSVNMSGAYLIEKDFTKMLSEVERNETGHIISAKATQVIFLGKMNATEALLHPVKDRGEPISKETFEFEGDMIKVLLNETGYPEGLKGHPNVRRSFGDIASSTILGDIKGLVIGYMLLLIYVQIMLGRMNFVEQRAALTLAGVFGVIMGVIMSYGICSAIGLPFGPMHNVLPFLMLGIGIDDMFVIVQCWDVLESKYRAKQIKKGADQVSLPLAERFGHTMSSAGGAITVTSLTDIVAFGIGGSTVLPALQSFCIFASVGILSIYFFQCTFFVAWMVLDQKRVEASRNACFPCYKHSNWDPNYRNRKDYSKSIFRAYSKFLTRTPTKVAVMFLTMVITGLAVWGNIKLEQRFDPAWFLPQDTYLAEFVTAYKKYFPSGGDRVTIYCSGINVSSEFEKLDHLATKIKEQTDIVDNVDSWTFRFTDYYNDYFVKKKSDEKLPFKKLDHHTFSERFAQFLYSPKGSLYRSRFLFEPDNLTCGQPAPDLELSTIMFQHKLFPAGPSEHIPAMNRIKSLISDANITGKVFPISIFYPAWETDEIIAKELYRNIGLATICVFFTTLFLLNNIITSLLVIFCVMLSLVDVAGFMYFWGVTIDTVSCVNLVIAIGLCVDYSAHIAHRFTEETGASRNQRAQAALTNIGPAVLNGGISTFLAFVLLAGSKSHVFSVFFKIFFLVVTFGLFQGLVVLPVLLSIFGPPSDYIQAEVSEEEEELQKKVSDKEVSPNAISDKYIENDSDIKLPVLK